MHIHRIMVCGFMIDEKGKFIRVDTINYKKIYMSEYFSLHIGLKPIALSLIDFESGKEILKNKSIKQLGGCHMYPIGSDKIACNYGDRTGVWNIKKNTFHLLGGACLGAPGINYNENMAISCSMSDGKEAYIYDVDNDRKKYIFPEYKVRSPRFSPDGSRFAFFGEIGSYGKEKHNYLIIQTINDDKIYKIEFLKGQNENEIPSGRILSWSKTGKFLAGTVIHYFAKKKLYIWKGNGDLVSIIPLEFNLTNFIEDFYWVPVWLPNDSGVAVFYWDNDRNKISYKIFNIKSDLNKNN